MEDEPEDNPENRFVEPFPHEKFAGATFGKARTTFDAIRNDQILQGAEVLGPFKNDEEWALAKWLIKNVGHNAADEFLKLAVIQHTDSVSFGSKDELYRRVDELPSGVGWHCREVVQEGDLKDVNGRPLTEKLELWYRDPVDCVKELMGNPVFKDHLAYAPTRVYQDRRGQVRQIDEMWTGNWWWDIQQRLPVGSTVIPFRGDKSVWPVYLTIGNLSKDVQRSPSMHGTILLGYLPVGKFDCFSEATQSLARYQAFHACLRIILGTMVSAGQAGTAVTCADGQLRHAYPILAAYAADYPEQCLVACCQENRCPTGEVSPERRGEHEPCVHRKKDVILNLLDLHHRGELSSEFKERFKALGLHAIHEPFWRDLPHADIFSCFTPDLLHQLHKGVFKDHLVKWCTILLGEDEMDNRFRDTPPTTGLRHFKNGISHVSQWTGHEHKEMEKIFVALIAGGVPDEVLIAVRALVDFIFTASLQSHTTLTLLALRTALDTFHTHKQSFINYHARNPAHFNIPKYHMLEHYVDLIYSLGSADGFNTEWSERLHIDYAKEAYRASNKKDYTAQMTKWLSRQEAVDRFSVYIEWPSCWTSAGIVQTTPFVPYPTHLPSCLR
ncbi:hypothetical protein BC629DRAFT_1584640 [Irpex lacteus]|nr:hypothetical protein BC629DRAFT_1584640 [Irpex lacteus]